MKIIVSIVLLAIVNSQFIADKLSKREIIKEEFKFNGKDFLVGFLLAMRFVEKVPDALVCNSNVDGVKKSVETAKDLFHQGGIDNVVKAIQTVADALDAATHGCGNIVAEVDHYLGEIKKIVTGPTFKHDAEKALYTYAEVVGRDVADLILAFHQDDSLTAGTLVGDIVRIIIWGEPNPRFML